MHEQTKHCHYLYLSLLCYDNTLTTGKFKYELKKVLKQGYPIDYFPEKKSGICTSPVLYQLLSVDVMLNRDKTHDLICFMLDQGADVNVTNADNWNGLFFATYACCFQELSYGPRFPNDLYERIVWATEDINLRATGDAGKQNLFINHSVKTSFQMLADSYINRFCDYKSNPEYKEYLWHKIRILLDAGVKNELAGEYYVGDELIYKGFLDLKKKINLYKEQRSQLKTFSNELSWDYEL